MRPRISLSVIAGCSLVAGCSWYRPAALAPASQLAPGVVPTTASLQIDAEVLRNPLLTPTAIDLADGMTPDEAALLAVLVNPDLVAARDARGEAAAQVIQAGLLPNPDFGIEVNQPHGALSDGLQTATSMGLGINVRKLLTLSARRAAAVETADSVDLGVAWQEWQTAQQARLLAVRLGWLRRRHALVQAEIGFEAETATALERAVDARDVTIADLGIQRAALEAIRRQRDDLEREEAQTTSDLLALFGAPLGFAPAVVGVPASDDSPPVPRLADILPECLMRRLDLVALRHGYDAEEATLRQAVIEQLPDLTVGLSRQADETSLSFFGGFVSIGVPAFDRNQAQIALHEATRTRLRDEYAARVSSVRADLDALIRVGDVFARRLPEVRRSIEPLVVIEDAQRGAADRGDVGRLVYQTVRTAVLDQRLQEAQLAQGLDEMQVGLEAACGGVWPPVASESGGIG